MSGATITEFLAYWEAEGQAYVRRGDYRWMAALVPGQRVLEIGCGLGFATAALLDRGLAVLSLDALDGCVAATRQRIGSSAATLMQADVMNLDAATLASLDSFAPDTVVCWLMGAPADTTGATVADGGRAVVAYRERIHRRVAELAATLGTAQALHLVDRTAIAWQAKDIGRDTLVNYHTGTTLAGLPFVAGRHSALYRKLGDAALDRAPMIKPPPSLKGVVPTLASLLAERKI